MNPKRYTRLLVLLAVAAVSAAVIAPAAQAATPAPGYTQFAGCPTKAEFPNVSSCLRAVVSSGRLKLGNKDTPITNPIIITGGTNEELGEFHANAEGGLKPAKQKVPGGVVGLTGLTWLLELLGSEALTLYATAEAAGLPVFEGVTNITLPLKVHLENSTLGSNCYVGTVSNPVTLHLTTGTSGKLTGKLGTVTFSESTEIQDHQHEVRGRSVHRSGRQRLCPDPVRIHSDQHQRAREHRVGSAGRFGIGYAL